MQKKTASLIPFSRHRTGAHLRVSTDPQDDESQEVFMRGEFAALGLEWPPADYVLREKESGYKKRNFERRPILRRSVELCESGELRAVMFVNVSRVTRYTRDGEEWYERMHQSGARVHFAEHPGVDLFAHGGREWFLEQLKDAEKFSLQLGRHRARGYAKQFARGEYISVHPAFGARSVDGMIEWTQDARIVRWCITQMHDGEHSRDVAERAAKRFDRPVKARDVVRWCRNPIYFGLNRRVPMTYGRRWHTAEELRGGEVVPAKWRGLVPREWYADLDASIAARANAGRGEHQRTRHLHHFGRGYLKCEFCGASMIGEVVDSKRAGARVSVPAYTCGSRACAAGRKAFPARDLMRQFGTIIERMDTSRDIIDEIARRHEARDMRRQSPAGGSHALAKRRRDAALALASKRITIAQWQEIEAQIDADEAQVVRSTVAPKIDYVASAELAARMASTWRTMDDATRAKTVRALFAAVAVDAARKRIMTLRTDESIAAMLATHPALRARADGVTFDVLSASGVEDAIRDAMARLDRPATAREIAASAGLGMDAARPVVQRMAQMALIVRTGHRVEYRPHPKQVALWALASKKPL